MAIILTVDEILRIAREKSKNDSDLCRRSGVSRATLWRMGNGKLKTHARSDTLGKLAQFILGK